MIEAVLFDLFETLITESGEQPSGASSLGPRLGLDPDAFRIEWQRRRPALVRGQLSFVDALAEIGLALGISLNAAQLEQIRLERVRAKARVLARVEPGVLVVIDELLRRGKHVGLISNCIAEDVEFWPESELAQRVPEPVFSFAVGLAKPEPAIYSLALERLGVAAQAAVFVGDGESDELAGASRAGLCSYRATWFLARWRPPPREWTEQGALGKPEDVLALDA